MTMRLGLTLGALSAQIGEAATFLVYTLQRMTQIVLQVLLFTVAMLGVALTAAGTALLWVVAAAGGVQLHPITVRLPHPHPD